MLRPGAECGSTPRRERALGRGRSFNGRRRFRADRDGTKRHLASEALWHVAGTHQQDHGNESAHVFSGQHDARHFPLYAARSLVSGRVRQYDRVARCFLFQRASAGAGPFGRSDLSRALHAQASARAQYGPQANCGISGVAGISADRQMNIVIPGGSGQVGQMLARHFHARGYLVTVLSRNPRPAAWRVTVWDGVTPGDWVRDLEQSDVCINLAGRSVNCRYSAANRRTISESRIHSTRLLNQAIASLRRAPRLWVKASTATISRHGVDRPITESDGELGGHEPGLPGTWNFSPSDSVIGR